MTSFQKVACWFLSCCTDHTELTRVSCFVLTPPSLLHLVSSFQRGWLTSRMRLRTSKYAQTPCTGNGAWLGDQRPGRAIWGEAVRPWPCPPGALARLLSMGGLGAGQLPSRTIKMAEQRSCDSRSYLSQLQAQIREVRERARISKSAKRLRILGALGACSCTSLHIVAHCCTLKIMMKRHLG